MTYIENLIANGTNFSVKQSPHGATFAPAGGSEADLEAFQGVVRGLRLNGGDDYCVHLEHSVSDRPGNFIDLVIITFMRP